VAYGEDDSKKGAARPAITPGTPRALSLMTEYRPPRRLPAGPPRSAPQVRVVPTGATPAAPFSVKVNGSPPPQDPIDPELAEVIATYRKWLDLPDAGSLEIMLAAYAANRLAGDPVWLFLVGPPSGGKGEVINPFQTLPNVLRVSHVSEASLLSGTPKDNRSSDATGGLLRSVGEFGIFAFKDFTSVFTMNRDERGKALSALRECYDGSWDRPIGAEGARILSWHGKLGIIGGVTEAIDSEHAVMAKLGPRFLLYRLPRVSEADADKQAHIAIDGNQQEQQMRSELLSAVHEFFKHLDFAKALPRLSDRDKDWIAALTTLAVRCRSHVERSAYNHEIMQIPESEGPGRMTRALTQLWGGLALIGIGSGRRRELIRKTALDGMPPTRRIGFDFLACRTVGSSAGDIARTCRYPEQPIRRALQDLACHGIVANQRQGKAELWRIADGWKKQCALLGIRPENSRTEVNPFSNGSSRAFIAKQDTGGDE
jgi:hypothetical protein